MIRIPKDDGIRLMNYEIFTGELEKAKASVLSIRTDGDSRPSGATGHLPEPARGALVSMGL
jgi:hypothetical protein